MGASYRRLSVERRNALPCAFFSLIYVTSRRLTTPKCIIFLVRRNLPFTVVATKSDKLPKESDKNRIRHLAAVFKLGEADILPFRTFKNGKRSGTRQNRTYNLHRNAVDATRRFSMHFLTPLHIH